MDINLPYKVRAALYILTGISGPVVAYFVSKGKMGAPEVALYTAEVTVMSAMAAFNTRKK